MNLHGIVASAIGAVNPLILAQVKASQGYVTGSDGSQAPQYASPVSIQVQAQALQYDDLKQLDGLNIQGVRRALYLPGNWNAVVRSDAEGGDLLRFPDRLGGPNKVWLVVFQFESWPDWTKVAVTLQLDQAWT